MDKQKTKAPVVTTVWRHWKPTFRRNGWLLSATLFLYSVSTYLGVMLKPTQWKLAFDALSHGQSPWPAFSAIIWIVASAWLISRTGEVIIVLAETRVIKQLKDYALYGLMRKSTQFYNEHASGGLVAKVKRFAGVSEAVIDQFIFSIIPSAMLVIYLVVYTAFTIPNLSIIFASWIVLFLSATYAISRFRMKYDLKSSKADSITTGHLADILLSIFTFRIFSCAKREYKRFTETTTTEFKLRQKAWFMGSIQWAVQGMFMVLLEIICMSVIIRKVVAGTETIGTAIMVQAYIVSLSMYMWGVGQSLVKIRTAFADAHEMSALLDEQSNEPVDEYQPSSQPTDNTISFVGATFCYGKNAPAIDTLDYVFQPGTHYGLVGFSGSGKTTLTKILLRLHELQSGTISIGGVDITLMDKADLRSLIAFVPQQMHFPNRTVREIIAMGQPNATDEMIEIAARKASCDFIWEKLPYGLDTYVGERGVKLSGGECQRLAIAAAILKDAPIVIMDEPTSALDAKTERTIQRSIRDYFPGKTVIIIAHRLSTVAMLDEVLYMRLGKIVHSAPHDTLLEISEEYRNMWHLQTTPELFV